MVTVYLSCLFIFLGEQLLATGEQNKPFATGWGKVKSTDKLLSDDLKQIALPVRSQDDKYCRVIESEHHGILTDRMMCAGYADGSLDTCKGDSGGPLVRKWRPSGDSSNMTAPETAPQWQERWYQIGIISWGESCAKPGHYGYYTHLPILVSWVKEVAGID